MAKVGKERIEPVLRRRGRADTNNSTKSDSGLSPRQTNAVDENDGRASGLGQFFVFVKNKITKRAFQILYLSLEMKFLSMKPLLKTRFKARRSSAILSL